jgi:uncharacterized Zn-binding protein involved in type VI secretion
MGQPAAKQGDHIEAVDNHFVMVPTPSGGEVPTPLQHKFKGVIDGNLSSNVNIGGHQAATQGSTATNQPEHRPTPPGTRFHKRPANRGKILSGSATVRINGKPAARSGDQAETCAEPVPNLMGRVTARGNVFIGG